MLNGQNTVVLDNINKRYGNKIEKKLDRIIRTAKSITRIKLIGSLLMFISFVGHTLFMIRTEASKYVLYQSDIIALSITFAIMAVFVTFSFYKVVGGIFRLYARKKEKEAKALFSQKVVYDNILGVCSGLQESSMDIVGFEDNKVRAKVKGMEEATDDGILALPINYRVKEGEHNEISCYYDHLDISLDKESMDALVKRSEDKVGHSGGVVNSILSQLDLSYGDLIGFLFRIDDEVDDEDDELFE